VSERERKRGGRREEEEREGRERERESESERERYLEILKTQFELGEGLRTGLQRWEHHTDLSFRGAQSVIVNMGSVTRAVLKMLLLLSTQNWNRVEAGNSCKYTAGGVYGGTLQNFDSAVFMMITYNWNFCRAYCYK
jgi:hypothetical protein